MFFTDGVALSLFIQLNWNVPATDVVLKDVMVIEPVGENEEEAPADPPK